MSECAVDTSAWYDVVAREPDYVLYKEALIRFGPVISAATLVETSRVLLLRGGQPVLGEFRTLMADTATRIVPVDVAQARLAIEAAARYGKGRGAPPAVLNYGDLFSYALAKALDLSLLYKGRDFAATDVRSALAGLAP